MKAISHSDSAAESHSTTTPRHDVPRILVVDDEPLNRAILEHIVQANGYEVVHATNGQEALCIAIDEPIDLVLLDISMPILGGLQVVRLLRQLYDSMELPVIMVTSADDNSQLVSAFRNGANDYINKPVEPDVVLVRIEAQLKLRDSEERYALASRGTNDGLWDWNLVSNDVYFSERWKTMLGMEPTDNIQSFSQWVDVMHPEDVMRVQDDLETHLCGESEHFETELRLSHRKAGYRWMLCRGLAVRDKSGSAVRIAGSLTDITDAKVADALTGLPNRLLFQDRVQRCLEQARRYPSRKFAVMYLDIDKFKMINDNFGHEAGDRFLVEFARRLEMAVRSCDSAIARLGGDEFAVLVEGTKNSRDAERVAVRIIEVLEAPFEIAGNEFFTAASIGIAEFSDRVENADALLREADTAMYYAKQNAHVPFKSFTPELNAESLARLELGSELRRAIERDELVLHYQPIVDAQSGMLAGFEALIRWDSTKFGMVMPSRFIPLAEETGLIVSIGEWVLKEACETISRLATNGKKSPMISVNVSTRQMTSDGFVERVLEILDSIDLAPERLKLEVTESAVMRDPEQSIERLNVLRNHGVTIGLDDFGTGYSSLAYLHHLPLKILKIDRSFVAEMVNSTTSLAIVKTIVRLADSLDLDVIAEGVETDEQLQILKDFGCQYVQGFYLSRPLPESEIPQIIASLGLV